MQGFAQIPGGHRGTCSNTFDFTGSPGEVNYSLSLEGYREGPFALAANPDIVAWSSCGASTAILNMNAQCYLSPSQQSALIAV